MKICRHRMDIQYCRVCYAEVQEQHRQKLDAMGKSLATLMSDFKTTISAIAQKGSHE